MRDIKTYLSVAPVLSTLWFGALAGLLIEINRLFPDALSFPFFNSSYCYGRDRFLRDMTKFDPFQSFFIYIGLDYFVTGNRILFCYPRPL